MGAAFKYTVLCLKSVSVPLVYLKVYKHPSLSAACHPGSFASTVLSIILSPSPLAPANCAANPGAVFI